MNHESIMDRTYYRYLGYSGGIDRTYFHLNWNHLKGAKSNIQMYAWHYGTWNGINNDCDIDNPFAWLRIELK